MQDKAAMQDRAVRQDREVVQGRVVVPDRAEHCINENAHLTVKQGKATII